MRIFLTDTLILASNRVGYSALLRAFQNPSNSKPLPGKLTGDEVREKSLSVCTFCGRSLKTAFPRSALVIAGRGDLGDEEG